MTTALTAAHITDTALFDLVLVRMALPSKEPVSASAVRRDVGKLLGSELSTADFDSLRSELASAGFLTKGKRNTFALTDSGREPALQFLGIAELPAQINWSTVIATYLFPKAAGLPAEAAAELDSGDKLAAFILKRKYGLAAQAGSTVNQVLEAVACERLGFPHEMTLSGLLCGVLSTLIGSRAIHQRKACQKATAVRDRANSRQCRRRTVQGGSGLAGRHAAIWASAAPARTAAGRRAVRLDCLCRERAKALSRPSPPEDRFHDNKVFIAALWRATQEEPSFPLLSLPEFKQRLVEANSQNLLHLSRADLVQAMDPQLVADSETAYLNATFHFVLVDGNDS